MHAKRIAFWVTTGLVTLAIGGGGLAEALQHPATVEGLKHLGYPPYFGVFLGTAKIAGAITLLLPRLPRLKEWAYAGAFFDLTAATVSHAVCGSEAWHVVVPAVLAGLALVSSFLRPASRSLKA